VCFKEKQKDDERQTSFLSHWIARSSLILLLSFSDLHSPNSKFSYDLQVRFTSLLFSDFFRPWLVLSETWDLGALSGVIPRSNCSFGGGRGGETARCF
jgi:hypothetical protein